LIVTSIEGDPEHAKGTIRSNGARAAARGILTAVDRVDRMGPQSPSLTGKRYVHLSS
jgi:hypothetical protein